MDNAQQFSDKPKYDKVREDKGYALLLHHGST